ncbi:hypothetical protein M0805_002472 [Coniferiporia weirii]|nr:hypothetical protein M0805_002472 [Coniferiporia weirii]
MDDILERPTSNIPADVTDNPEDAGQSSDEDDGGPDWTKLTALASAGPSNPFIPKRGDKEFEPANGAGTNLQQHKLERVRAAMFSALDVERTVSSKVASYAVWRPEIARARVLSARGNHLLTMGHNVPRRSPLNDAQKEKKAEKAVDLLPEEALYLIERGSMFCWVQVDGMRRIEMDGDVDGTPMTVQQAYTQMIGREDLTLERYQVFAYLKRLGYTVTRARAPSAFYNTPTPFRGKLALKPVQGVLSRVAELILAPFRRMFGLGTTKINWWRPLRTYGPVHRFLSYASVFSALRFIPSGYELPTHHCVQSDPQPPSPYEVFFNVYKPSTPFRKTAPPPPDYSIIVVNGRSTPMPTLQELTRLFEELPELPPPVPRKRQMHAKVTPNVEKNSPKPTSASQTPSRSKSLMEYLRRIFRALFFLSKDPVDSETDPLLRPRRPNPFQMLKNGKKMVVVAAVDAGMISFFRFCQGAFDEWPMA